MAPVLQALPQPLVLLRPKAIGTKIPGGTPQLHRGFLRCFLALVVWRTNLYVGTDIGWRRRRSEIDLPFPTAFSTLQKSSHPVLGLLALLLSWFPVWCQLSGCAGGWEVSEPWGTWLFSPGSVLRNPGGRLHPLPPSQARGGCTGAGPGTSCAPLAAEGQREDCRWRSCPGNSWSFPLWRYSKSTWVHSCVSCSR